MMKSGKSLTKQPKKNPKKNKTTPGEAAQAVRPSEGPPGLPKNNIKEVYKMKYFKIIFSDYSETIGNRPAKAPC